MATLQELRNLGMEDARILVEEMIETLAPKQRELARKEIASPNYHSHTIKILARSRKRKMELQGNRIRPDKFRIETEAEDARIE
ncbi:MAG: hypothetical protein IMZ53_12710 [Thermoplasmata archaeon]|nr:hypothetical protein [Thermoplasmata archaeon]